MDIVQQQQRMGTLAPVSIDQTPAMRKIAAVLAIVGLSALLPTGSANAAREYGSRWMSSTRSFTWVFLDRSGVIQQNELMGYACETSDALLGMTGVASADRYEIRWVDEGLDLKPLNGVTVTKDSNLIRARTSNPDMESVQFLWQSSQINPGDDLFTANIDTDSMGRACVDGGIASVLGDLEREHGIRISR